MKRNTAAGILILLALGFGSLPVLGDETPDLFADLLFAPDLVMKHQAAIGLSSAQRRTLVTEITQAQADFVPYQMDMAELGERLERILAEPRIEESEALDAATEIMELEGRIKRRHLALAVRIKNLLTEEQQLELARLRSSR